jgi:hypothetical protein
MWPFNQKVKSKMSSKVRVGKVVVFNDENETHLYVL